MTGAPREATLGAAAGAGFDSRRTGPPTEEERPHGTTDRGPCRTWPAGPLARVRRMHGGVVARPDLGRPGRDLGAAPVGLRGGTVDGGLGTDGRRGQGLPGAPGVER